MSTVTFANGKSVTFEGTPTPQDIEEVAAKMGIQPDQPAHKPQMTSAGTDISPENVAKANAGLNTPVPPTFPADQSGGAKTIIPNVARAFGNIPSDAAEIVRSTVAAPINFMQDVRDLGKLGPRLALPAIGEGFADTFKGMANAAVSGVKSALQNPAGAISDAATLPINHPLLIPSLMEGAGATRGVDAITTVAKPVTKVTEGIVPKAAENVLANQFRKTANMYVTPGRTLAEAESHGSDPIGVLSSYGNKVVPVLENGKVTAENATEIKDFLGQQIGNLSRVKNDAVFLNDEKIPFKDFKQFVLDNAEASAARQGWDINHTAKVKEDLANTLDTYEKNYGNHPLTQDGLPIDELDKIKTQETKQSKSYSSGKESFQYDAHGVIGSAARKLVEMYTDDAPTKELNKLIQSHYDAMDLIDGLIGKTPNGGRFTKTFERLAGETLGAAAGMPAGHPIIGSIMGRMGADFLDSVLTNKFISSPLKRLIVKGSEIKDPAVVQKMLQYIDKNSPAIEDLGKPSSADALREMKIQKEAADAKEMSGVRVNDTIEKANELQAQGMHSRAAAMLRRAVADARGSGVIFPMKRVSPKLVEYYPTSPDGMHEPLPQTSVPKSKLKIKAKPSTTATASIMPKKTSIPK